MVLTFFLALGLIAGELILLVKMGRVLVKKRRASLGVLFAVLALLSAGSGVWYMTATTFQISEQFRIQGLPFPLVVFVREEQQWTDFVTPTFLASFFWIADALLPLALLSVVGIVTDKCKKVVPSVNSTRQP